MKKNIYHILKNKEKEEYVVFKETRIFYFSKIIGHFDNIEAARKFIRKIEGKKGFLNRLFKKKMSNSYQSLNN